MAKYNFATANLSFAFAMGDATMPTSEKKWLEKILEEAKAGKTPQEVFREKQARETDEEYLQARSKDVMDKIVEDILAGKIDAIGLQELNHNTTFGDGYINKKLNNIGFYQHMEIKLEDFTGDNVPRVGAGEEESTELASIDDTMFRLGHKYCMISLMVEVQLEPFPIKPTVALIYDINKFGKPVKIEGRDFHNIPGNKGRPMLGVKTDKGFVLMVMHAPNVNPFLFKAFKDKDHPFTDAGQKALLEDYYLKGGPDHGSSTQMREVLIPKYIQDKFMAPMEREISEFIKRLKKGSLSTTVDLKTVLMGDMNDTNPNKPNSLSDWLKNIEKLQFSVPKHGTCCYNWDSSNSKNNPTRWLNGKNSHPHTEDIVQNLSNDDKKAILAEKAQLKNYDFKGDLIYYSENLVPVGKQRELFPQNKRDLTSQYSDHVFQVITLKDKGSSGGGRKRTLKRKRKKTRKHKHKRKMTKRKKMKKRRSRKHRSR